jgi:hypothetical protein
MRLFVATTTAALALLGATSAGAQPTAASPVMTDERCLLAMVALSNTKDPKSQSLGEAGVIYYTGRLAGRDPNFNFAQLKSLVGTMTVEAAQTELQQRCVPAFQRSMQQVQTALAPPPTTPQPPAPAKPPPGH